MSSRVALLAAAVASVLAALSLFLPYAKLGGVSATGFELLTRADVLLLIANLLAAALLAGAAVTGMRPLQALGLAAAAVALGGLLFTGLELVKQIGRPIPALSFGFVPDSVVTAKVAWGAIAGILASALATVAALASTFMPEPAPAPAPTAARARAEPFRLPAAGPPPGWYDDPSGGPRRRYWDGERWTEHVEG
jgi:hypothetical protein